MERRDAERAEMLEQQNRHRAAENEAKRAEKDRLIAEARRREEMMLEEQKGRFKHKERLAEQQRVKFE